MHAIEIHHVENACYRKTDGKIYNSKPGNATCISQARFIPES